MAKLKKIKVMSILGEILEVGEQKACICIHFWDLSSSLPSACCSSCCWNWVCRERECEIEGGDLFKAPEPIVEEPVVSIEPILDPMTAAISMMPCVDHNMPTQDLNVGVLESLQNNQLFGEVSYDCKKDILGSTSTETHLSEVMDIRFLPMASEMQNEDKLIAESVFQKSVSSGCLSSMDWMNANTLGPNFLDFSDLDFGAAYGMRRAFSEGDIKALGNGNISLIQSSTQRPPVIGGCTSEDRQQKLSRYRNKKSKRNFGRKIKYACRKALADSQPRIRGRFAKTEETEFYKRH